MEIVEQFAAFVREAAAHKLEGVDVAILDALKDGEVESLPDLRAERARLRGLEASIVPGDRAALVAQWPRDFPALPLWFADPSAAAELDPPGAPCVVECRPVAPPADVEDSDKQPAPDLKAMRAERETFAREDYDRGVAALDRIIQTSKDPDAQAALAPAYQQLQADLVARLARISAADTVEELREL